MDIENMSEIGKISADDLIELVRKYTGLSDIQSSAFLYKDMGLDGGDYVEFMDEVEQRYSIDLSEVSSRDGSLVGRDVTVDQLAETIRKLRAES